MSKPQPSVEEVLASLDVIAERLRHLHIDAVVADVAALDDAIRVGLTAWSSDEGLQVLYRVDDVLQGAMTRRAEIIACLADDTERAASIVG